MLTQIRDLGGLGIEIGDRKLGVNAKVTRGLPRGRAYFVFAS